MEIRLQPVDKHDEKLVRVLLFDAVEEVILFSKRSFQMLAGDVTTFTTPKHFYHCREHPNDVTFGLVGTARKILIKLMAKCYDLHSLIYVFLMLVLEEKIGEGSCVTEALENAVHIA